MKDINLLNYLSENNIDIPNGFNISVVSLPSKLNKSLEINSGIFPFDCSS